MLQVLGNSQWVTVVCSGKFSEVMRPRGEEL